MTQYTVSEPDRDIYVPLGQMLAQADEALLRNIVQGICALDIRLAQIVHAHLTLEQSRHANDSDGEPSSPVLDHAGACSLVENWPLGTQIGKPYTCSDKDCGRVFARRRDLIEHGMFSYTIP